MQTEFCQSRMFPRSGIQRREDRGEGMGVDTLPLQILASL